MAIDLRQQWRDAERALQARNPQEAIRILLGLLDRSHVPDQELARAVRALVEAYDQLGMSRAAAAALRFLGDAREAHARSEAEPIDRARALILAERPAEAALAFEEGGWLGHAAIQREIARDDRGARVLWERLAGSAPLQGDLYTRALVSFNLARAAERTGDAQASRRATIESVHFIEAAADGFETRGLRERAFDCFQVLLAMGKEGGFENLAEGYLNCIRILAEDNLRYYVLQYYEDFQTLALERRELHAASTLFREAAEYSRRHGMPYEDHYRARAGETLVAAAEQAMSEHGLVEMAENSYAAAIDAFNDIGAYTKVCEVYERLAALPLAEKRRDRYARLRRRLEGVPDEPNRGVRFPDYLRVETAYPEVWRADVMEWEQGGSPAEAMAEIAQDRSLPSFTRRRALLCQLSELSAKPPLDTAALARIATYLGGVEVYACHAPLEHLYEQQSVEVRQAVMEATQRLFFKRAFVLISQGLRDPAQPVRQAALAAVRKLHFSHAFDPLQRIYRESTESAVRLATLSSISQIPTLQSAELMLDVLSHGEEQEAALARGGLVDGDQPGLDELLRRAAAEEDPGPLREALLGILRQRGH